MSENTGVTKQDLLDMETRLTAHLTDSLAAHLTDSLAAHLTDSLTAHLTDSLTAHLTDSLTAHLTDSLTAHLTDSLTVHLTDSLTVHLTEHITQRIMERVGGRIDAVEERLKDYIAKADHDLETKIITEFHKWGRTSDMRTRQAITDTGLLGERMLAVEDRVSALERERRS